MSLVVAPIAAITIGPAAAHAGAIAAEQYGKGDGKSDAKGDGTRMIADSRDEILNKVHGASYHRIEARS